MYLKHLMLLALALLILPQLASVARAAPEIAIGPEVSTTGIGIEASTPLISQTLNLNAGVTGFGFSFNLHIDSGELSSNYHAKVRLGAVPLFLTYYPFGGAFNLQGGVLFNDNRVSFNSDTLSYEGITGKVIGQSHFNLAAPFLGLGFGQPFEGGRFTFTGNLGVAPAGGPSISLRPSVPLRSLPPQISSRVNAYIRSDEHTLNHDAKIAQFFPLLSLGVVYRF